MDKQTHATKRPTHDGGYVNVPTSVAMPEWVIKHNNYNITM